MRICIDLDGTISANPGRWTKMMVALMQAGHEVTVLTGMIPGGGTPQSIQERSHQLRTLGVPAEVYREVRLAVGNSPEEVAIAKAAILEEIGADFFFDDTLMYIEAARRGSSSTIRGWIT